MGVSPEIGAPLAREATSFFRTQTGKEMDTPAEVDAGKLGIPDLPSVLEAVAKACGQREADFMEADFFLIGALARDVLLEHIYGIEVPLTTGDVDVAVAVEGWQAYEDLRRALAEEHGFERGPEKQRLRSPEGTPLDLVPFGGAQGGGRQGALPAGGQSRADSSWIRSGLGGSPSSALWPLSVTHARPHAETPPIGGIA